MSRIFFLSALLALAARAPAATSTFDHDAEGWQTCDFDFRASAASDFAAPDYVVAGGAPGGFVSTPDVDFWCFLAAPLKFLGDDSTAFGTSLSFDTRVSSEDGSVYPSVVLQGGGLTIYSVSSAPAAAWTSVSIPLVGSSWLLSSVDSTGDPVVTGAPVGDATLRSVLGDLTGMFVEADWDGAATDEVTGLDNVRLDAAPVPEPAALVPLALGSLGFLRRYRSGAL